MIQRLARGFCYGAVLGLVYTWADTLATYTLLRENIGLVFPPFTATTRHLAVLSVGLCAVAGAILLTAGGRFFARRPTWFVHGVALALLGVAVVASPAFDRIFGMGVLGILAMDLVGWVAVRFCATTPGLAWTFVPAMAVVWYGVLGRGLPPPIERPNDPLRPRPPATAPNILFVVFDTTRADHVSALGYARPTTPTLSRLAAKGTAFARAYATSSWTLASHASMFTGLYSSQNNCHSSSLYLDTKLDTLAEQLYDAGYNTAMFSGNPWLDDYTRLSRGFSVLHPSWRNYTLGNLFMIGRAEILFVKGGQDKGAIESRQAFEAWFDSARDDPRPFFAFINYFEAHNPYHQVPFAYRDKFLPPGKTGDDADAVGYAYNDRIMYVNDYVATADDRAVMEAVYDGGINYIDTRLGEILDMVEASGRLEDTLIVVAGDHGEMFGEMDTYIHEFQLYNPLIHVPLFLVWPGEVPAGKVVSEPVELIDLYATILEYAGLDNRVARAFHGTSLQRAIRGRGDPDRPVFAEVFPSHLKNLRDEVKRLGHDPDTWRLWSVTQGNFSLIRFPFGDRLYDIGADPAEPPDVTAARPGDVKRLGALIDAFVEANKPLAAPRPTTNVDMDAVTREQLKAMGYVIDDDDVSHESDR